MSWYRVVTILVATVKALTVKLHILMQDSTLNHTSFPPVDRHQHDSGYGTDQAKHHHLRHADRYKVHLESTEHVDSQLVVGEVKRTNQEGQDGGGKDAHCPDATRRDQTKDQTSVCLGYQDDVTHHATRGGEDVVVCVCLSLRLTVQWGIFDIKHFKTVNPTSKLYHGILLY